MKILTFYPYNQPIIKCPCSPLLYLQSLLINLYDLLSKLLSLDHMVGPCDHSYIHQCCRYLLMTNKYEFPVFTGKIMHVHSVYQALSPTLKGPGYAAILHPVV